MVSICPWWDGPSARQEIGEQLALDAGHRRGPWFWIYHAPPSDSPTSWAGKRHYGDDALVEWIARFRPDGVLCGHIHQSPFRQEGSWVDRIGSTWIFNAGRQIGPIPAHIIFDSDSGSAIWHSLAGSEIVDLADAESAAVPRELTNQSQ